jgi:glycine cleavage system H protein
VVAVNEALVAKPETVNEDAQGAGWFARIRLADPSQLEALMDRAAYEKLTEGL